MNTSEKAKHSEMRVGTPNFHSAQIRDEAAICDFIRRISHEIGNPLTSIISLASVIEYISDSAEKPDAKNSSGLEKLSSYSRLISKEAWKITALTHRLVHLVSNSPGVLNHCNVFTCINNTLDHLRSLDLESQPQVTVTGTADEVTAFADAEQLRTVIFELLMNSIEAVADLPQTEHSINIHINGAKKCTELIVSNKFTPRCDTPLSDYFKPFVSDFAKHKHLGLGLSVCWAIIERFGGSIELRQQECTFFVIVRLPTGEQQQRSANSHNGTSSAAELAIATKNADNWTELHSALPKNVSVLIIEDEETVATAIEKILSLAMSGHTKLKCTTALAEEALALIEEGNNFDAILCDLNLGKMSGQELYSTLHKRCPEQCTKLAFLTGSTDSSDTDLYLATSSRPYLFKPFEPAELLRLVLELLER